MFEVEDWALSSCPLEPFFKESHSGIVSNARWRLLSHIQCDERHAGELTPKITMIIFID